MIDSSGSLFYDSGLIDVSIVRDALASAIQNVGNEGGKLTIHQFIAILKQLVGNNVINNANIPNVIGASTSSSANNTNNTGQGLAFVLLCR